MRDNHKIMPEIISAFEASGHYFGIVAVEIEEESRNSVSGFLMTVIERVKSYFRLAPSAQRLGSPTATISQELFEDILIS